MNNKTNIIFLSGIILSIIALPLILINTDWSYDWFLPVAVILLIIFLLWAMINKQNCFLFLLIILPAVSHFNYLKINIFSYLPMISDYQFYLNPVSLLYLLLIAIAISAISGKIVYLKSLPLRKTILAAVTFGFASIFWSAYPETSAIELIYMIVPFSVYLFTYLEFSTETHLIKLILAGILSSIIPSIAAFGQLITKDYFYEQDSSIGRLTGGFDHPNTFGLFLFLVTALMIIFFLAKQQKTASKNKLFLSYLAVLLVIFVLTYSRTSWLCFVLFVTLFAIVERAIIILLATCVPLTLIIYTISGNIRHRITEIFDQAIFNSFTARINIWKIVWKKITENPIIGYGIGTAEPVIEEAKDWQGGASLPHNDFLLQQIELGAIGLLLYIAYSFGAIFLTAKTYIKFENKNLPLKIWGRGLVINFKTISFGLLIILLAFIPATIFESLSQKIIIQIIIWSILGSLFSLKKEAA